MTPPYPPLSPTDTASLWLSDLEPRPLCCCRSPRTACSPARREAVSAKIPKGFILEWAHLQFSVLLFEFFVLVRVAVWELVDLYPALIYFLPQLQTQYALITAGRCSEQLKSVCGVSICNNETALYRYTALWTRSITNTTLWPSCTVHVRMDLHPRQR